MKQFFKFLFSSFLGTILALLVLFFILMGSIAVLIPKSDPVSIDDNSILSLNFSGPISDRTSGNPFEESNFNFMSFENKGMGLNELLETIDKAKRDDKIKGIYVQPGNIQAGMATIEEIRDALADFKSSGKFILSYSDYYPQRAYYLASVADKIYLNPQGALEHVGLRSELMFFKKALDKYGIEPEIIRGSNNKFKSAVEPFMYEKMSDANREQMETYMGSLWNKMLREISSSRNISIDELNRLADELSIGNANDAVNFGLVDATKYLDEVHTELSVMSGEEADEEPELVSYGEYKNAPDLNREIKGLAKNKVAVIYASGEITMGKGSSTVIGSEGISEAIREARKDSAIKAIVLRVNSPGGSALASDVILREMALAKEVKPVVVSMGDVAASGGYYIACMADTIVASENTLTGSIGVFGLFFNVEKLMNERIGLTFDRVKTNEYSDIMSGTRKITDFERQYIQKSVDDIYDTFIGYVAEGRKLTKEEVDAMGQGRVWSGENAKANGLIDVYGGLSDAIKIAADMAQLEEYRTVDLPEQKETLEYLMENLELETSTYFMKRKLGENYLYFQLLEKELNSQGIMARIPYHISIH